MLDFVPSLYILASESKLHPSRGTKIMMQILSVNLMNLGAEGKDFRLKEAVG